MEPTIIDVTDETERETPESVLRLRIATTSRATILRQAHARLQHDLTDLRSKARA